jgi:hypothetical protein
MARRVVGVFHGMIPMQPNGSGTGGDWLKLHRKLCKSEVFKDADALRLWLWILCNVNWKVGYLSRDQMEVLPGSLVFAKRRLADELGWTPSKTWRVLKKLESWGMVTKKADHSKTTLSVCNWRTYQVDDLKTGPVSPKGADHSKESLKLRQSRTYEDGGSSDRTTNGKSGPLFSPCNSKTSNDLRDDRTTRPDLILEESTFRESTRKEKAPAPKQDFTTDRDSRIGPPNASRQFENSFADPPTFARFWAAYPFRSAKGTAQDAWAQAVTRVMSRAEFGNDAARAAEWIIGRATEYAASDKGKSAYAGKPATWLNGDCFDDDIRTWNAQREAKPRPLLERLREIENERRA